MARSRDSRAWAEAFVLRARRVMSHWLLREHADLMEKLYSDTVQVEVLVNKVTAIGRCAGSRTRDHRPYRTPGSERTLMPSHSKTRYLAFNP